MRCKCVVTPVFANTTPCPVAQYPVSYRAVHATKRARQRGHTVGPGKWERLLEVLRIIVNCQQAQISHLEDISESLLRQEQANRPKPQGVKPAVEEFTIPEGWVSQGLYNELRAELDKTRAEARENFERGLKQGYNDAIDAARADMRRRGVRR